MVAELTDDKALPKAERKALQIASAPKTSARAALVKLGDKASNVRAIGRSQPVHWDAARSRAYVDWAEAVADALPWPLAEARAELARVVAQTRRRLG
ncbi:hypothetical protein [Albidovulum sp.]|uniref:hypothetical protein n=1 Tax=Albidovulum sp. TaxID=1872424 RepID=UPI001D7A0A3C|nr:hypothetical protein [Xanthomonadales bacterium]